MAAAPNRSEPIANTEISTTGEKDGVDFSEGQPEQSGGKRRYRRAAPGWQMALDVDKQLGRVHLAAVDLICHPPVSGLASRNELPSLGITHRGDSRLLLPGVAEAWPEDAHMRTSRRVIMMNVHLGKKNTHFTRLTCIMSQDKYSTETEYKSMRLIDG